MQRSEVPEANDVTLRLEPRPEKGMDGGSPGVGPRVRDQRTWAFMF